MNGKTPIQIAIPLDDLYTRVFKRLNISPNDLYPLLKYFYKKDYPRKSFILNAGDTWNRLYYIHRGLIRMFYTDLEGREYNKAFFAEGQCIWPVAPKDRNQGALFSIAAIENTTLLECPFEHLYNFLNLAGKWEEFALPFAETLVEQKFQREHDFLLLSAKERFENFSAAFPHLVCRIPDYHFASFLGITNVSLSRIKKMANC